MGVIRVERGGPTIWPWVMGLLIAAVVVWALTEALGGDPEPPPRPASDSVQTETVQP